jgi:hypothetical protein
VAAGVVVVDEVVADVVVRATTVVDVRVEGVAVVDDALDPAVADAVVLAVVAALVGAAAELGDVDAAVPVLDGVPVARTCTLSSPPEHAASADVRAAVTTRTAAPLRRLPGLLIGPLPSRETPSTVTHRHGSSRIAVPVGVVPGRTVSGRRPTRSHPAHPPLPPAAGRLRLIAATAHSRACGAAAFALGPCAGTAVAAMATALDGR